MKMTDFKALTFDCYGTLIDWESGIYEQLAPYFGSIAERDALLEAFAQYETAIQQQQPGLRYDQLLAEVFRALCGHFGQLCQDGAAADFGASVGKWPAFPDTAAALQQLRQHFKLYVLSNVDGESFRKSNEQFGVVFDGVFTAEDIGSYKPELRNFQYLKAQLAAAGIAAGEILHTAQSLYHDIQPANAVGLATAWIDRRQGLEGSGATSPVDPSGLRIDFHFRSLAEMAAGVEMELI
ncbi:MAG: haloacid dehalogenase type II [Saprospiraceae bacterium]|nr:haloacid dehalogenase type II [Saprospiraceae bacterium]MDP4997477.1 haloacid dehalogenase type II [Saprospiraceae bacterium]